jgi:hypothetical protein
MDALSLATILEIDRLRKEDTTGLEPVTISRSRRRELTLRVKSSVMMSLLFMYELPSKQKERVQPPLEADVASIGLAMLFRLWGLRLSGNMSKMYIRAKTKRSKRQKTRETLVLQGFNFLGNRIIPILPLFEKPYFPHRQEIQFFMVSVVVVLPGLIS